MKSFSVFLLIVTIACVSVIHSAPVSLTRNNHPVGEPLGFLANFILNKRSRVVQNSDVVSDGRKRAVDSRALASPRYKNTYLKGYAGSLNGNQRDLPSIQKSLVDSVKTNDNDMAKSMPETQLSLDDLASRNERTVAEAPATQEEVLPVKVMDTPAEVTAEEVAPVKVMGTPVVDVIETAPAQIVDVPIVSETAAVASAEASVASNDGSAVSVDTSAVSETIEKESPPVKVIQVPIPTPNEVVYVKKDGDYLVTLKVIHVEFIDPVDSEPTLSATVSKDAAPIETAPVEVSAGVSTSSNDESSSVSSVAETVADAIVETDATVIPVNDEITPTEATEAPATVFSIPVVALPVSSLTLVSTIAPETLPTKSYVAGKKTGGVKGAQGYGGDSGSSEDSSEIRKI